VNGWSRHRKSSPNCFHQWEAPAFPEPPMPLSDSSELSIELVASKGIKDSKVLASSPSLVVDKHRYDGFVQSLVVTVIKE
jgi:hypothetical protein